jgi:hypothetical protein
LGARAVQDPGGQVLHADVGFPLTRFLDLFMLYAGLFVGIKLKVFVKTLSAWLIAEGAAA